MADFRRESWEVETIKVDPDFGEKMLVKADSGGYVADTFIGMQGNGRTKAECEANAFAIAATPRLYRACKAALPKLIEANGGLTHGIEEEVEMLRDAITFAETHQG